MREQDTKKTIIDTILARHECVQAIYLFGSYGTENEWPDSDVDIAILFPPEEAKRLAPFRLVDTQLALSSALGRKVDLINLRQVDTVFRKEVVMAGRRIYTGDAYAADEFEMLTISFYLKLNEERAEIIEEGVRSGKFYGV